MTTILDDFADDILDAFADIASPAVYQPKAAGEAAGFPAAQGGAAVATFARITHEQAESESRSNLVIAEARVPARDVPAPQVDDVIEVDGVTWTCRKSSGQQIQRLREGPFWIIRVTREQSPNWRRG
ncbi:MAG: hypothetical protein RDU30_09940 [Desulfovibrionaceae bacterium]|nr:hypothetical protein [Desulfovibrionaceae bacterium]